MKKMPNLNVLSGIDKKICGHPMKVNKLGLEGDEHDPTFHGGPDKAILGCKAFTFAQRLPVADTCYQIAPPTIPIGRRLILRQRTGSFRAALARTL